MLIIDAIASPNRASCDGDDGNGDGNESCDHAPTTFTIPYRRLRDTSLHTPHCGVVIPTSVAK